MTDVESVLKILSKLIYLSTKINLTAEQLRLAKCNQQNDNLMQNFWSVLNILSHSAVNKLSPELNFQNYCEIESTKIYFAYLGYDSIEFYKTTDNNYNSRTLLLALGWLIATQDCLNTIINDKIIKSILGRECINSDKFSIEDEKLIINNISSTILSQIHLLIHKFNNINNNLKEIIKLIEEKITLITKIHSATSNTNYLPHLNIPELLLLKKIFTNNNLQQCNDFDEFHAIGKLIKIYTKWTENEEIFFNWLEIVLEDSENMTNLTETTDELSIIISNFRYLIKKKIHTIKMDSKLINQIDPAINLPCASKFVRTSEKFSSSKNNDEKLLQELNKIHDNVDDKLIKFNSELKSIIKSIPNCLQV